LSLWDANAINYDIKIVSDFDKREALNEFAWKVDNRLAPGK
jgi:hypothetical protein